MTPADSADPCLRGNAGRREGRIGAALSGDDGEQYETDDQLPSASDNIEPPGGGAQRTQLRFNCVKGNVVADTCGPGPARCLVDLCS